METKPTTTMKLLLTGAFIALATSVFGQSIKVEQYETSSGQTFLVEYGSFFSLANSARVCQQDSVKLTAVGFSGTISWTKPDNSTVNGSSIWVKQSGTYSVSDGTNTASTSLSQSSFAPEIYSNEYPVSETGSEFDVDDTTASTPGGFIPLFQSTQKQQWLTPESRQSAYSKMQFMITADELTNFGFEEGTTLNEIGFNYTDDYYECSSSGHYFQISVYEVVDTTLSAFESSNSNYLGSFSCGSRSQGWNYFGIGNYEWNGTSTLVFEFDGYTYSGVTSPNPEIQIKQTPSNRSVVSVYGQSITSSTPSYSIDYRPLVSFKYKRPARQDSIIICDSNTDLYVTESATSYLWSSASNSQISTDNYLSSHNTGGILYLTTSQSGSLCKYVDTVDVVFNSLSIPSITATSADFCEGETVTLSASSTATVDFVWSNGDKGSTSTISEGGDYTVTVTDEFGCSKTSSAKTIKEIEKPLIFKDAEGYSIYDNQSHYVQGDDNYVNSFGPVHYLFDYNGEKYFTTQYNTDSTTYVNVISNNQLAEIGVIDNANMDNVFIQAHYNKYQQDDSKYPYTINVGATWNNSNQEINWYNQSSSTYNNYSSGNTLGNNQDGDHFVHYWYNQSEWWTENNWWHGASLVKYDLSNLVLASTGEIFCDSVQLFAPSIFDSFTWSTGDTTESIWVSGTGSHSVYVSGSYEKSDGTSCSLTSDTYTFTINSSPALTITNESGTEDLDGSNTIELEAAYTSGSTISWSTGATADSIFVTSAGEYTATVELNGCSTTKSVNIYEPIYVAKTGSDATGDGSSSSPYLTIQKGIDEAYDGQKIYVLPGTYEEGELDFETSSNSGVYKSVYIASDFVRLNDTSAIASTIIDADGSEYLIDIRGANSSTIQGFTLTGQSAGSSWECAVIRLNNGASLTFKDLIIRDNTSISNQQEAQVMNIRYQSYPRFENVVFKNNASNSAQSRKTAFIYSNAGADFISCTWEDNYSWESVVRIQQNSRAYFENNIFIDNGGGDWGIVDVHENNCEVTFVNTTIVNNLLGNKNLLGIGSGYTNIQFINSVFGKAETGAKQIRNSSATTNVFTARNSVLPYDTISGALNPTQITWDVDATNVFADPQLDTDGTLNDNSPAIGIGTKQPVTIGSTTYTPPMTDLAGVTRPDPAGSNPDAGAYESDKAQGDFDVLLTQCGYLLEATVLNSNAYAIDWIYNGDTVSTDASFIATGLGTYTAYVTSTDRNAVLSETISLTDPLRFVMMGTKNNCTDVGSSNGYIRWGQPQGGSPNSNNNYYSWVLNSSNNTIWGSTTQQINHKNNYSGYHETSNLGAGTYYINVSDITGCTITDTVEIVDQDQDTYYVSTSGSDSNNGTSTNDAWGSIEYAISQVCDEDTIIVLDGVYYEDSLDVTRDLVLGSMYLIDGDTSHISNTIIDGGNDGWIMMWYGGSNSWSDTTSNQVVGLTIRNGNSVGNGYAGGLTVYNNRVLKVKGVRFEYNQNNQDAGGAMNMRYNSYVELQDVKMRFNHANEGGAFYSYYGYSRFFGLDLNANTSNSERVAIYLNNARSFYSEDVTVRNHNSQNREIISMNMWDLTSDAVLKNWIVRDNSAQARLFAIAQQGTDDKLTIENCLIINNTTQNGGPGLLIRDTRNEVFILNSTIADNRTIGSTSKEGGAMIVMKSPQNDPTLTIVNSIVENEYSTYTIAENQDNGFDLNIENSFIEGGSTKIEVSSNSTLSYGTSNLSSGLYFTDAANGDYSLSSVSTLLGAGVSSATVGGVSISAPTTDLYGNPRPNPAGTNPDLGAIEGVDSTAQIGIAAVVTDNGFCQTANGAITANLLNYTGTATYSWSSSTYPSWTWNATQSATSLASGDYKVVAIDASTGAKIDSLEVTVSTTPSISIANTSSDVTCFGDDDGELTFEISGGNPLGGSQYNYSVDYLEALAQATGVVLPDNGSWFNDDNNSNSRTNKYNADNWNGNPIYQGKYYVSVSDQDGCTFTDTVVVGYDHELPLVNITTLASDGTVGLTSMCEGTGNTINLTANVTGGGGTNAFSWSNASTAQTVGVAQTDEYYVEVTDQYTCVGRDTVDIVFQSAPQVYVDAPAIKTGEAISDFVYLGEYNDHHYYYYTLTHNYTWDQAKNVAEGMGAYLWSVNSRAEHEAVASMYQSQNQVCCEAFLGAYKEGGQWKWHSGEPFTFTNWAQNEPSSPNYDTRIRIQWGWWDSQNVPGQWEDYGTGGDQQKFIFEFPSIQQFLSYNESFCDSVEVFAGTQSGVDFDSYVWVNSATDTIGTGSSIMVSQDVDFKVYGQFVRSDGQSCDLASSDYSIDINNSPNLEISALSGTYDFANGDSLLFLATTDSTGAGITWSNSTSTDTLMVTSLGDYTATAEMNGCSVSETFRIEEAIYVAKTGSNTTGNGSLSAPYKTIQFAIDTAESGSKIYVLPGTYNENLVIDKQVRLYSDYVRLGNAGAMSSTVINAGFNGRVIEFSSSTRLDKDSTIIDGFTIKNGDVNGNEGSGIYASWNQGSGITINNSIISYNRKQCCSDGIAIALHGVDLYLNNVDISNNGSLLYWDERSTITLRYLKSVWNNVRFRSNEANNSLVYLYDTDLQIHNSDFIGNTVHDNNESVILVDWGSDLLLNHVTMTNNFGQGFAIKVGNNDDAKVVLHNSLIDGFTQGGIKTAGASNQIYLVNSIVNNIPASISGNASITKSNSLEIPTLGIKLDGSLQSTSPAIGLGNPNDTTIAGYSIAIPRFDLSGNQRPIPTGSNPDAGAYEDSLSMGDFGLEVQNCGYAITSTVLNSSNYSVTVTGVGGYSQTGEEVIVSLKGTYLVTAVDSISGEVLTQTVAITNPLTIDYLWSRDACASNGGYGEIVMGDFSGGVHYNVPGNNWYDYELFVNDSVGNNITHWYAEENNWSRYNTNVTSGKYVVQLSDASGCSVYDTVIIEDVLGSKYYVSTTGSDASSGVYSDPLATIQEALNRACDGDTIVLFDGEYFENVEYTSSSLPYVTIASEYIDNGVKSHIANTIVNGMDEDPVFDISNHNSTTDTVKFVGFTITNGKSSNWYGGGGISSHYSNVALKHMVVSGNRSGHAGGGIGTDGGHLNLWHTEISNNIADNEGGGIRANYMERLDGHGSTVIKNNKTNSNGGGISYGHGHWNSNEDFYIKGFTIENNSANSEGGGLYISNWGNNNGELLIENIKILNNRSIYNNSGGMYIYHNGEDAVMKNVIIANNRSNNTGGLTINDVDLNIVHSTIYANPVLDGTSSNDQIELQNNANVLFLNSAVGGQVQIGATTPHTFYFNDYDTTCDLTIANSIVQGGINSIDNSYGSTITGTPIGQPLYLMNPAQGDYMLSPVSQGLGAAASFYTGITMPYLDIEGMARPNPTGSNPDVGAVESPLDTAEFGAAYEIRNNIACDPTYGRLKVTPLNGSGSYKYELDDLTGTATFADQQNVSSYTYSSLYSGEYLVTITDLFDSSVFTDTVEVSGKDSLNIILDYNNEFCAGANDGSISIQVTGGDGYYDYTWSTVTNSNFPKSNNLNNLYPDEYFVTVKDGDNCFIEDSVTITTLHQLPSVAITGNINKGGSITQTTNSIVRACAGDLVSLDAGTGFFSYNWSTEDQLNSWTTQTLSASYEESFYVTVVDSFGCSNVDSVEVFYVQRPAIFASNVNTNIGGTYQQVTSYVEGSNQYTGFSNEPKPYGANNRFAKMQFIIPANELIAEGLTDQTTINSLGFEVDLASGSPVQNFKIKLKNTTSNQLSSTFETGLTEVYDFNILTAGDGWNTHEFDQGFVWDGTKNLLIQVEYSNVAFNNASNTYLIGHSTSYTSSSVATNYSSSVANQTSADNTYSWRPNMKFGIDKVQATDTLRVCDFTMLNTTDDYDTYSWLIDGTSQGTQLRYSLGTPEEVVLKTVDAASSCTMYSDTVQVLLDTTPSVFVTSNSLIGCVGDSVIAQVDTVKNNIQYQWSNGVNDTTAAFVESGTYYIYAVSPSGCQGVDTVNVDINIPPDVVIELNGRVLTATDGSLISNTSSCDTTLLLPYSSTVDTLSELNASEWTSYSSQFLEWEFNQGWDSLVDYTGPQYDADSSYHGGFYQFDPASITDQGKTGYLQLGCVNLVGMSDPTIEFAYHMVDVYADSSNTSDQMGTLAFEIKESSDDSWTTLWQRSGTDESYDWVNKVVSLSGFVNQTVQMRWKATAGVGGPRTEMAIDNISINDSLATLSNISGRLTPETVCEGDSLYAKTISNGSSNFTYLWSNGQTDDAIALTQTGWYGVSVIDGQGCEITSDSVFIEVNPAPNNMLVLSDTTQYCFGEFDSLTISAVSGYSSYEWNVAGESDSSNVGSSFIVDSIVTGTTGYYVTITDSVGCRANSEVVNLIQRDNPMLQFISNALLCNDDSTGSIDLTVVGNGGFDYGWNTGDTTQNVEDLSAGWYSVTVVDSFSCTTIDSVEVVEPTPVVLTQGTTGDVLCFGGNDGYADYTFSGGVGGYTYAWTDSSGTWSSDSLSLANAPIGTYYLNAQDSNGCSLVDTVSIDQPSELILTLDSTVNLSCYQSADGQAFASVVGGFGSYTYRLDGNVVSTLADTTLNAGSHTYSVTDDNGCTDSVSFTLTEPQLLTASTVVSQYLGGIQISCNGANDGSIDVTVNGGTLPYTFSWTDGDTTEDRSMLVAGTYSMTVQDAQGCEVTVNEVLLEPTQVQMTSMVTDLNCYGVTDAEVGYTISGGTAPYATSWSGSAGTAIDSVYVTFQVDMQGASINTGGIQVVSNSGLNLPMNIVPVLEDSIYRVTTQVSTGSTIQYRFFNGSSAETVPTACGVNVSGTFYREVQVLSDTTIAANAFNSCTVSTSALSGAMISGPRTITGLGAGIYTMNMSDVNGCTVTITDTIVNPDSLYISAVSIIDASCPQTQDGFIDVTVAGGTSPYNFSWSNGDTTEDITVAYGYYDLVVTDANGCTDTTTHLVDAPFPYNDEEICVVTVDSTGVNMVVWEKTPGEKTASYEIFRENASTQYVSVGSNQYNDMSTWADQNSNPAVQPYRYKIAVVDSCGNYSDTSDYHATIHLQASQGVAANEVNLQWTAYEGKQVETYYIYRWLSPINRILIDSVSSNVQTYTDIYPVNTAITALLYEVGAKFTNGGCSPSAGKQSSYVTSMSNMLDWGQDGGLPIGTDEWVDVVLESDLMIYPNPTRSFVNLELSGAWADQKDIRIKFTDMTGRIMAQKLVQGDGTHQFDFRELPAGIYFIQIITAEGRTIVERFEKVN